MLSPLNFALLALYVRGLILLERRKNGTRLTEWLPGRAHDTSNRLLTAHIISTRTLVQIILTWAKRLGRGHLMVDDVMAEKPRIRLCL